jgi:protein ImuB
MRLRRRPLEIVVDDAVDGEPVCFRLGGRRYRVRNIVGPERLETAWWRGPSVRRDYFRAELEDGRRWWLFRRLDDGRWFLHGEFD